MKKRISAPLIREEIESLRAGDSVLLSGRIYTGRDAAHKRLCGMLDEGEPLPFDVRNQVIYYAGPCPAKPGDPIGSCGPTTSYRMDAYTPSLCDLGLIGMAQNGALSLLFLVKNIVLHSLVSSFIIFGLMRKVLF